MENVIEKVQEQTEATARLCSHRPGAEVVTRARLAEIEAPPATETHIPVKHSTLIEIVEESLYAHKLTIEEEQFSILSNGMKVFGVLKLRGMDVTEYRMALGLRASNDKSIPVEMVAGANIFVCDNMAFNGEVIALKKRHTKNLDIRIEVLEGVNRAVTGYRGFQRQIEAWQGIDLSDTQAKATILDAGVKGVMPLHLIPDVVHEYFEPRHDEFKPRTLWSLHNAFTESFKALKSHVALESATELGRLLATV